MTARSLGTLGLLLTVALNADAGESRPGEAARPAAPSSVRPAVEIRAVRPDLQLERLLRLFRGSKSPHPAAALASWKRAVPGGGTLSKASEALITILNPRMTNEFRLADGATVSYRFPDDDGPGAWSVRILRDDGGIAAVATALTLSEGHAEAPFDGFAIDRLSKDGSAWMARDESKPERVVLLAGSRKELEATIASIRAKDSGTRPAWPSLDSGWVVRLDPDAIGVSGPVSRRRAGAAFRGAQVKSMEATATLLADSPGLQVRIRTDYTGPSPVSEAVVDPRWLDVIPKDRLLACWAFGLGSSNTFWNAAFRWLDAIEKADPAFQETLPLGLRIRFIARAVGVRLDNEVLQRVRGVSGFVLARADGQPGAFTFRLHLTDDESAERLFSVVIPRFAQRVGLADAMKFVEGPDRLWRTSLWTKSLDVWRRGSTIKICWGTPTPIEVAPGEPNSAGPILRKILGAEAPFQRMLIVWPERTLRPNIEDSPPAVWIGRYAGTTSIDQIQWSGLHELLKRSLDALPLNEPPYRSAGN